MMAFSEHFLGASLIASPLQWIGFNPITAYNLTFLASFPLCGVAAYALSFTLTRRQDAAFVCGLAYAFNPYRVAHVQHLELLLGFGMPAALAALHSYAAMPRVKWLAAFAAALVCQALFTSYYALFFTLFFGLWILWFMRLRDWRHIVALIGAGAAAAVVVSPIVLGYSRIHEYYPFARDFGTVLSYSGDLSSLAATSPLSAVWGWTSAAHSGERQLFPGLTITALAIIGIVWAVRSRIGGRHRPAAVSVACWAVSAACATVAIGARVWGPWYIDWGWLRISVTAPFKPLSLAVAFAIVAVALSPTARDAFRRRSVGAFYLLAASVFFLCTLGPQPTFLGERILYEPPYAWLMRLPFFGETVRVPGRFAMLGILALSVVASLVFDGLMRQKRQRVAVFLVVIGGIAADGWIRELPLPVVPQSRYPIPSDRRPVVMELPLGKVSSDTAALYRATVHGMPTLNGYNGYEPPHYQVLRRALADRDPTILAAVASLGPILIAIDDDNDPEQTWTSFVSQHADAPESARHDRWTLFHLQKRERHRDRRRCAPHSLGLTALSEEDDLAATATLTDHNPATSWNTWLAQRAGDSLTLDLGRVERVCELVLSMGSDAVLYPGALGVSTSVDNATWKNAFTGWMGGAAFLAALENPRDAKMSVPLPRKPARFVRLHIERSHTRYSWAVAEIMVRGTDSGTLHR